MPASGRKTCARAAAGLLAAQPAALVIAVRRISLPLSPAGTTTPPIGVGLRLYTECFSGAKRQRNGRDSEWPDGARDCSSEYMLLTLALAVPRIDDSPRE